MRKKILGVLVTLLVLGGAACQPADNDGQTGGGEGGQAGLVSVADIPAGTLMRWFDFSWFAFVPPGEGIIGHDEQTASDHAPQHTVEWNGFWIQQSEVSNRQYRGCVSAGECTPPPVIEGVPYWFGMAAYADHPVTGVTWDQAGDYCNWIHARLPTEAEWEIAARGTQAPTYPWGEAAPDCNLANFAGCQDPDEPDAKGDHPTGASPYAVLDTIGNVREWVHDWYAADWYPGAAGGPATGTARVVRGGGYLTAGSALAAWQRDSLAPDQYAPDLGFRCVLNERVEIPPAYCQVPPLAGAPAPPLLELPPSEIAVNGYCEAGVPGVVVSFPGGEDPGGHLVLMGSDVLHCNLDDDHLACWGSGLGQDMTTQITVCPDCPSGFYFDWELPGCRPFLLASGVQQVEGSGPPDLPPCPPGELYLEGFGCWGLGDIECLPGYYYDDSCGCIEVNTECDHIDATGIPADQVAAEGQVDQTAATGVVCMPDPPVCTDGIPSQHAPDCWFCEWVDFGDDAGPGDDTGDGAGEPGFFPIVPVLDIGDIQLVDGGDNVPPADCGPNSQPPVCPVGYIALQEEECWYCRPVFTQGTDCPEGSTYDDGAGCCLPDKPLPQACPEGYIYQVSLNACVPTPPQQGCRDFQVYIPVCESKQACFNPDQYKNQSDCEAGLCRWVPTSPFSMPHCTYP